MIDVIDRCGSTITQTDSARQPEPLALVTSVDDAAELRRFYRPAAWTRLSNALRRARRMCEACGARPTFTVDHVVPLHLGGARWARSNLRAVCADCHRTTRYARPDVAQSLLT